MKTIPFLLISLLIFNSSCKNEIPLSFTEKIETAHHKIEFQQEKAIEFDILLVFGNKTRLFGKMTLLTYGTKGLIEKKMGSNFILTMMTSI